MTDTGREWRLVVDSVEKLWSRGRPKILKPLQATTIARHEGTLGRGTRLRASPHISLDACQTRIDARTLTLQQIRTATDLQFFNRIGRLARLQVLVWPTAGESLGRKLVTRLGG